VLVENWIYHLREWLIVEYEHWRTLTWLASFVRSATSLGRLGRLNGRQSITSLPGMNYRCVVYGSLLH